MSTMPQPHDDALHQRLDAAMAQVNRVLLGKPRQVKLAFTCLVAGGHLLLEDVPGVGKTTLAHALAATFSLEFQRVQFTSDLLPSDIIGVSVYERESGQFRFHPGPIFTGLLLADEINRASPKTQSALLEAMAENQVTIDGHTHALAKPFFVVATQNPLDLNGTFPLPDSQLDRFMLRLSLDYPDAAAERALLTGNDRRDLLAQLGAQLDGAGLLALHRQA
jgi:MoxR-like ATPase